MSRFPIIPGCNPSRVFELIKGAFNPVPLFVERGVIGPGLDAAGPRGNHGARPQAFNVLNERLTIIPLVSNDVGSGEAGEEGPRLRTVMPLAPGHDKAQGTPPGIAHHMNLCSQSPSGTPQSRGPVPPFPVAAC